MPGHNQTCSSMVCLERVIRAYDDATLFQAHSADESIYFVLALPNAGILRVESSLEVLESYYGMLIG